MPEQPKNQTPRSSIAQNVLTFLAMLGILFALWLVVTLKALVVLIIIAIVFSTGLAPGVARLERMKLPRGKKIPRAIAILLVFVFAAIIALGAVSLILVPVVKEVIDFSNKLPTYRTAVTNWLADISIRYTWMPNYGELVQKAQGQASNVSKFLMASVPAAFGIFGSVISLITVIVLTFYLLASYEDIKKSFMTMIPKHHEKEANRVLSLMASTMGGWLRGQLLLAGIIGALTAAAMLVIGVPYPFVIAMVGAIGELVPMVGPFAAAVPAVIITATSGDMSKLAISLVFFAILANVEGNILAPKIMQKQVGLSPLVTLIALIAGASLLGIVGALLAIPIAAVLRVLYMEVIAPAIRKSNGRRG